MGEGQIRADKQIIQRSCDVADRKDSEDGGEHLDTLGQFESSFLQSKQGCKERYNCCYQKEAKDGKGEAVEFGAELRGIPAILIFGATRVFKTVFDVKPKDNHSHDGESTPDCYSNIEPFRNRIYAFRELLLDL